MDSDNNAKISELEKELQRLKDDVIEAPDFIKRELSRKELTSLIRKANEMILYHKSEIIRLEMIKNGGFPLNYFEIPNLTDNTYKMLHSFALFLAEHKIALEVCGVYELGAIFKLFRNESLGNKFKAKEREMLKDIKNKSKIVYGDKFFL